LDELLPPGFYQLLHKDRTFTGIRYLRPVKMQRFVKELIEISRYYGSDKEFVIGSGGNTSCKDEQFLFIKASGVSLRNIPETGFLKLDREKLRDMNLPASPESSVYMDQFLMNVLVDSTLDNPDNLRPSIETPLHNLISYRFVVHTHSTKINSLLCSKGCEEFISRLFAGDVLYLRYSDPGYAQFQLLKKELTTYRKRNKSDPKIILVQNHGIFVSADSIAEVRELYDNCLQKIAEHQNLKYRDDHFQMVPVAEEAVRWLKSITGLSEILWRNSAPILQFTETGLVSLLGKPLTIQNVLYCKSKPLFIPDPGDFAGIKQILASSLERYHSENGFYPKIVLIQKSGMFSLENKESAAEVYLDIFEDMMKIIFLSQNFYGPHFLTPEQIKAIENWAPDNYLYRT
jgi:rhamnose utilization protein RhaD (predicted bifunctional aldolase and dehydrogenase)